MNISFRQLHTLEKIQENLIMVNLRDIMSIMFPLFQLILHKEHQRVQNVMLIFIFINYYKILFRITILGDLKAISVFSK